MCSHDGFGPKHDAKEPKLQIAGGGTKEHDNHRRCDIFSEYYFLKLGSNDV